MILPEPDPDCPRVVRIVHADGTLTECSLARSRYVDLSGDALWLVIPPEGLIIGPGDGVAIGYLPPNTSIKLAVQCMGRDGP